jgi:fructosamine-3-kinase
MPQLQTDLALTTGEAERLLAAWLGEPVACTETTRLHGGLVNSVLGLEFDRPPYRAVVKLHSSGDDTFAAEARALEHLRRETACPCPRVYLHDSSGSVIPHAFLLMERLPGACLDGLDLSPAERSDVDVQLAEVLVELHGHTRATFGPVDGRDGRVSWPDLFVPRLEQARRHPDVDRRLPSAVLAAVDAAILAAGPVLDDAGVPTLVHGDVWEGNLIVRGEAGRWHLVGLLDPGSEYADVESELAYLEVFDHRRAALFAAYTARRPLRPGYERRRPFYWLLTALVHVGLFGDPFFCEYTARVVAAINEPVAG